MREREYASRCSPRLEDSSSERLPEPRTSSQPLPTQPACYEARRPVQHRCSLAPMRVDTRSLSTVSCVLLFALLSHSLPRVCLGRCLSCLRLNCCIEKNKIRWPRTPFGPQLCRDGATRPRRRPLLSRAPRRAARRRRDSANAGEQDNVDGGTQPHQNALSRAVALGPSDRGAHTPGQHSARQRPPAGLWRPLCHTN